MHEVNPSNLKKSLPPKPVKEIDSAVIRFGGDSGDGMQLVGDQFTSTSAVAGLSANTISSHPSGLSARRMRSRNASAD